jgi:phospholipid/cholesterol/gamma-HCH transport system substrate-binding protein
VITARTKKQLLVFVFITLLGVSYVGAKYAQLGSLFYDSDYNVNAHFDDSGGIFQGAEVDYRGVTVGKVSDMKLTDSGVTVVLSISKSRKTIPANTLARVANRSAVGEQYVDLEPKTNGGPYLHDGSVIKTTDTRIPVSTTALLTNLNDFVKSVPRAQLRTVVTSLGQAFQGTGPALAQIIDTTTSFIRTANDNFDVTTALIKDSKTVLQTQVDETSAIKSFSKDLSLFTDTLAGHDASLRKVIDSGSATATELRTFLQQNQVDLGRLISNLLTTGKITYQYLPGIRQILVLYPYLVTGAFAVVAHDNVADPSDPTDPDKSGRYKTPYDARFGLIFQQAPPTCTKGYESTKVRSPTDLSEIPLSTKAGCTDTSGNTDPRGPQNIAGSGSDNRAPVASYDVKSGHVTWSPAGAKSETTYSSADSSKYGQDSWKWMLLTPASLAQE